LPREKALQQSAASMAATFFEDLWPCRSATNMPVETYSSLQPDNAEHLPDTAEPLLGPEGMVFDNEDRGRVRALESDAVDSERCLGPGYSPGGKTQLEALATPPVELFATLPPGHTEGTSIMMTGPHGRIEVDSPPGGQPGDRVRFLLGPTPEYSMEVPEGAKPGSRVRFRRADGVEVSVPIPQGKRPGDRFEVTPPALMVRVPEGAFPGDYALFRRSVGGRRGATEETEWCRAKIPADRRPGEYFAARLPRPDLAASAAVGAVRQMSEEVKPEDLSQGLFPRSLFTPM